MGSDLDTLLEDLNERGVVLRVEGDRLLIAPRNALTPELRDRARACKADLIRRLLTFIPPIPAPLFVWERGLQVANALADARTRLDACQPFVREFAYARWSEFVSGTFPEELGGCYAADLAKGLEAVLVPWTGWKRVRAELDQPHGPLIFPALWEAYAELNNNDRQRVRELGDPAQSPPLCLRFPKRHGVVWREGRDRSE